MKTEHFEAIERAKMHGIMPSMLAHELLVRDLVDAAMFEWQNIPAQFNAVWIEGGVAGDDLELQKAG